ncbi:MAG: LysE family translocator [Rhodobacteraceae bacterium]|nr:LysE family translocator [Paracoccaceae bacterium]
MEYINNLLIPYLVFVLAAASPGPATLAIMATSATHGRAAGFRLALGIINGSIIWGILAAFGLVTILTQFAWAFTALKLLGGAYLLWLAAKALRVAMTKDGNVKPTAVRMKYLYLQGLALHLTNPKALLSWSAIIAIGVPTGAPLGYLVTLLAGCAVLAFTIFLGYVLLFSTPRMMQAYVRRRRRINGVLAFVFGAAGVKLLTSQT